MADLEDAEVSGERPIPLIDPAIIEWLVATNPQKVIGKNETLEQAHRRAGFQDCIDVLTHYASLQQVAAADPDEAANIEGELTYEVNDPEQPMVAIRIGGGRRVLRPTRRAERPE